MADQDKKDLVGLWGPTRKIRRNFAESGLCLSAELGHILLLCLPEATLDPLTMWPSFLGRVVRLERCSSKSSKATLRTQS